MRNALLLMVAAALFACGPGKQAESDTLKGAVARPAAISFDGADYSSEAEKLAHGARLTRVLGCFGCHGDDLQGTNVTREDPAFGDMNAPNLTLLMAEYGDEELDRAIRGGVPKNGREFWFMPSEAYQFLSDADLSAVIAHLRSYAPAGKPMPPVRVGEGLRKQVADGEFGNSLEMIRRFREDGPPDLGEQHRVGRQLTRIVCAECHNGKLQGFKDFTPDLDIAGAYSHAELETLLTTGRGKSKPNLGLMTASTRRFSTMTPNERRAIINYVKARADRPQ